MVRELRGGAGGVLDALDGVLMGVFVLLAIICPGKTD